jgi:hypothetical protein
MTANLSVRGDSDRGTVLPLRGGTAPTRIWILDKRLDRSLMSDLQRVSRSLLAVLASVLLLGGAHAAAAQADSYGEIQRFGEKGTGLGQLEEPELAFGVDPANNSVYVVDQAKSKSFRIQKFSDEKEKGKYEAVASATFKPKDPNGEEPDEVEGVAVDSELKRVYVLAVEVRRSEKFDPETPAAGALYAFKTEPSGKTLEPAEGTTEGGVLVSQTALQPLSKTLGVSLLEPDGIAVNPKTHEVIIVATVDRGKHNHGEVLEKEGTTVLQPISDTGALGERYVDSREEFNPETGKTEEKSYFEECECVNSPVVSPTSGDVYVMGERDQIDEIPMSSRGATPPKPVIALECEEGCPVEKLTEFPGASPYGGAQLSIGAEGRFYARARIRLQSGGSQQYGGALIFSPTFKEEGWTGGQSPASEAGKCIVDDLQEEPAVAAGKEDIVFMLERNPEKGAKIVEFGPGGGGCPKGKATVPTAKAGGVEVEPVPISDKVTLSSTLTQANALSVEWNFGDGTKQTVSTREQQTTEVQHTFVKAGKLTVTETIHTDNLATPEIKVERTIDIIEGPTVVTEEEAQVEGTTVTMKGSVNPNGEKVTECEFVYGTSESYGSSAKCSVFPGGGEEPKEVSAQVPGLSKHTLYHFRLRAKGEHGGTGEGKDETLTTGPKTVVTGEASGVGQTAATLNATVNPEGEEVTDCHFEYGTTATYGTSVPCVVLPGSSEKPVAVSASVESLSAGTTYHFRIVATNAKTETSHGSDKTFTTFPVEEHKEEHKAEHKEEHKEETKTEGSTAPSPGEGGVQGHKEEKPPAEPDATLVSNSASVGSAGALALKITCPAGESACSGTVTLRTLKAVVASVGHQAKGKAAILTLATGSFTVAGGQVKTLTLHLSAKARALLARTHTVSARVTIVAHDPAGASHTTAVNVTLRAAKPGKHH